MLYVGVDYRERCYYIVVKDGAEKPIRNGRMDNSREKIQHFRKAGLRVGGRSRLI